MANSYSDKSYIEEIGKLLRRLIETSSAKKFALFFQKYHVADIADALETLSDDEKHQFFLKVKPDLAGDVLEELSLPDQIAIITDFKADFAAHIVEEMDPDDAVDLLEELYQEEPEAAERIIEALPHEDAKDIKELLAHPEDSAGAIMTSEFVSIPENLTAGKALEYLKAADIPDTETSFYLFITNKSNKLKGYTTLRNLLMAAPEAPIKTIRNEYPIKVHTDLDQEAVAKTFQKYDLAVIPVVDKANVLVGIVTVDDIVDVVVEEATEDLYKLSGTTDITEEKLLSGKLIFAIRSRLPWLFITIMGGFVSASIIHSYAKIHDFELITLALILSFVPMLMGLGGTVGNQSATIFVRGLSTGIIKSDDVTKMIFRETMVGISIGGILSLGIFVISYLLHQPLILAGILSLAMLCNITVASLIGATLPILFHKADIDPAVASAPFISTALDIISQLIYFALTFSILQYILG